MSATFTERPYVGHAPEMERVARGLNDAIAGRGRLVLLMGEPGIGKTRFCDEVTVAPALRAVPVFWGRGWESGGAPAYWPWLDVLAGLGRTLDDTDLEETLGDGASLIAALVPALRRRLRQPESEGAETAAPADEARFRLWRTVVALVRRAAEPDGLVLVFDDLHSADLSSLLLLLSVARELRSMRVLLLATCRDVEARLDPEKGALISRIGREGETLGLGRLDRVAVGELLRQRVGPLRPTVASRIFDSTQGNPLFLEEMLRLLGEEGPAAIEAGVVPTGVRDVIRQRLANVTGEARTLLDLAAVAGDEVQPALLALASRKDATWIDATIRQATHAGVFALRGGRLRFSHALVREVLYGDLVDAQRRKLHGVLGQALEQRHSAGDPDDPALPLMELAHHAIEGPLQDPARMVDLTERAAARAVEMPAPEEAIALLERALAAVSPSPEPRARLLLALGETRIRAGQTSAGTQLCTEAATLARVLGDAPLLARAALTYGRVFTFAESDPVLVALLEEALTALPPGDSPTRARLLARLGAALQPSLRPEEPTAIAREAIATARRLNQPRMLLETMHDGLSALMDVVDPRERRGLNLEVETLALRLGDRERLLRTHARLTIDALALGDLVEADARIDAFEALATELRAPWMGWRAPLFRALRATMHGRFTEAEQLVARTREIGGAAAATGFERAIVLFQEGFLRTAERHADMRAHDGVTQRERAHFRIGRVWQTMASAVIASRTEDLTEVQRLVALLPDELRPPRANLAAAFLLAEPLAQVGTVQEVAELHASLLPIDEQCVTVGMSLLQWEGPVTRLLALLEERLGRWQESFAHFQAAIARARRLDAGPHLARAQYEYGRALQALGNLGDRDRARSAFDGARAIAVALELPGLLGLVDTRLAAMQGAAATTAAPIKPEAAPSLPVAMKLEGEYWTLTPLRGAPFRLKDSLGLQYLARLMATPGREVHVLDLVATDSAGPHESPTDVGDAGELLDDEARASYGQRLDGLRETLTEAEAFGDVTRAAHLREEIAFLGNELARAVGLGGRARRAGGAAERARSAVQRRIKNALQRIAEVAPELAGTLGTSIRTGNFCEFRPGPPVSAPRGRS